MELKKLLLVTPLYPPEIGGPATYAKLLVEELPRRGVEVKVIKFSDVRRWPKIIRHLILVLKIFREAGWADVVFVQDTVSVGAPAALAAWLRRRPLVVRVPGDYAWEQSTQKYHVSDSIDVFQTKKYSRRIEILKAVQRFVVNRAVLVITPSIYFKNLVRGWVNKPEKVQHIYNGIAFQELDQVLAEPVVISDTKTLVTIGRLVPWKGCSALLNLLVELPAWRLVIIGDGPEQAKLIDQAINLGVAERVEFTGQLDRLVMARRLREARVFVLNTHFESFSFQVVEAMYLGVPVVTTRVGNLAEIITDRQQGRLVEPDDLVELKAAILEFDQNEAWRQAAVQAAQIKAKNFSIQSTLDQLTGLLKNL